MCTENFNRVTVAGVDSVAHWYLDPRQQAIILVGDRSAVEPRIAAEHVAPVEDVKQF